MKALLDVLFILPVTQNQYSPTANIFTGGFQMQTNGQIGLFLKKQLDRSRKCGTNKIDNNLMFTFANNYRIKISRFYKYFQNSYDHVISDYQIKYEWTLEAFY